MKCDVCLFTYFEVGGKIKNIYVYVKMRRLYE